MTEPGSQARALIGTWRSEPGDGPGLEVYGNVTLKFGLDGTLLYIVHETDRQQVIRLTYHVQGDFIVTDQPS